MQIDLRKPAEKIQYSDNKKTENGMGCTVKDIKKMVYHLDKSSFLHFSIAFILNLEYNHTYKEVIQNVGIYDSK